MLRAEPVSSRHIRKVRPLLLLLAPFFQKVCAKVQNLLIPSGLTKGTVVPHQYLLLDEDWLRQVQPCILRPSCSESEHCSSPLFFR